VTTSAGTEVTGATGAGFGRVDVSEHVAGARLVGYGAPERRALFAHDPLHARALVLGDGAERVAICSVELCYVGADVVAAARERIERATGIRGERVFVSATHTHSGPHDLDPGCWPDGLDALLCAAVEQACARLVPARVGVGWGMLHGVAVNRRRLEDPVDPAVLVLRVDDLDGRPLGLWHGFGCHPAVLGPDNPLASGDWPAAAATLLERRLGGDAVAVFGQGACADVNPLTDEIRARLDAGRAVLANAPGASYYGPARSADREHRIGNRAGGSFVEADRLGGAVADEVLRVHRGIAPVAVEAIWTRSLRVDPARGEPAGVSSGASVVAPPRAARGEPLEVMLIGLEGPDVVLVGAPVELFSESGVRLRRELRAAGVAHPFAVGYANGWRGYLPPRRAFAEGGYEVDWARATGLPPSLEATLVERVLDAVADAPAAARDTRTTPTSGATR
jgi:neutral/alkaline ceramidase-like enzyme